MTLVRPLVIFAGLIAVWQAVVTLTGVAVTVTDTSQSASPWAFWLLGLNRPRCCQRA